MAQPFQQVMNHGLTWDDSFMDEARVNPGTAGSITVFVLIVAVSILLWSFYRRYQKLQTRMNPNDNPNGSESESK